MFHLVLYAPEIPPNTGNIIRLCANTGCQLHLVEPLGFQLEDKQLRRAGLDYHEWATVQVHPNFAAVQSAIPTPADRWFALTTKGQTSFHQASFRRHDVFVFGRETSGLPAEVVQFFSEQQRLRLPMLPTQRSLNLSNTAAIVVYEAWRQNQFSMEIGSAG